jgi:hypothetical protein
MHQYIVSFTINIFVNPMDSRKLGPVKGPRFGQRPHIVILTVGQNYFGIQRIPKLGLWPRKLNLFTCIDDYNIVKYSKIYMESDNNLVILLCKMTILKKISI